MENRLYHPIPGITVRNYEPLKQFQRENSLSVGKEGRLNQFSLQVGSLEVSVSTHLTQEQSFCESELSILVFDGYLTDIDRDDVTTNFTLPALTVSSLYDRFGFETAKFLRGSFTFLAINKTNGSFALFTDRKNSRPIFVRYLHGEFLGAAPTVKKCTSFIPELSSIQKHSILEFMISGTFRGDDTLYPEVKKLPYASYFHKKDGIAVVAPYWKFQFETQKANEAALVDECDALLEQAVRRVNRTPGRKILFLSGGIDCRVILGYLLRTLENNIDVALYYSDLTKGDDAVVATQIAKKFDLQARDFEIRLEAFIDSALPVTLQADTRSEVLDSAPLHRFWETLSQNFSGFINGDESFGWHANVNSVSAALDEIGWFRLEQVSRLNSWLEPKLGRELAKDIQIHLERIVGNVKSDGADNLKDELYYVERLGNMLNGYYWSKLGVWEGYRPLIDEDVIDFITKLPNEWRGDKKLLRRLFELKFPDLHAIPASTEDVLPTPTAFASILQNNAALRSFMKSELLDNLHPELSDVFCTKNYKDSISALIDGNNLPRINSGWLESIPGFWRLSRPKENRVHPFKMALRLLQLNLYVSTDHKHS